MVNRDRIDVISQILEAANGGASKTRVMYNALIDYAQMKKVLTTLIEKDLIRYDKNTRVLRTTEKGLRFLEVYNEIGQILKEQQM
jgi:predicted transcriptional regulator